MTEYAQLFANRVKQTTATTGTGAVTWNAAVAQFFTFSFAIGVGTTTYYAGLSGDGINFEVGIGTPTANGMTRDVCLSSTNGNNFISLVGVSTFWVDIPASLVNALINMQPGTLLGRGATSIGDVQQLTIGTNLSIVGTTLNATGGGGGGVSVSGTPLVNQLTGWGNAATILAVSIGNNLSLVSNTLAAIDASGISVAGTPLANQIAQFNNAATVAALSIGNNLSLVAGTLAAIDAPSAVSIAGSPTSIFLTGWQNQTTITSVAVGANLSLSSGTLSATSNSGISITGTPAAGLIAGWASASSLLGVSIGPNISLIGGNTISAASGSSGVSVAGSPTSLTLTGWFNAATITSIAVGANLSLSSNTLSATSQASTPPTINTGTGLTGGPISSIGTIAFASVASLTMLANTLTSAGAPVAVSLTAMLDAGLGTSFGQIGFRNATIWVPLAAGTSGQFLQTGGTTANPQWASITPGPSAVSIAGSPTSLFIAGWQNATTITSVAIGNNLSLASGTLSAPGASSSAVSIAGSPTSVFLTGWKNVNTITSVAVGPNLSLVSGTLSASGATGSGAVQLLASITPVGTSLVSIGGIPSSFTDIILIVRGRSSRASSTDNLFVTVNADSGANYDFQRLLVSLTGVGAAASSNSIPSTAPFQLTASATPANFAGSAEYTFYNYSGNSLTKVAGVSNNVSNSVTMIYQAGSLHWKSVAAITQLNVMLGGGTFMPTSTISLLGRL